MRLLAESGDGAGLQMTGAELRSSNWLCRSKPFGLSSGAGLKGHKWREKGEEAGNDTSWVGLVLWVI